jgi:hypothetical protein
MKEREPFNICGNTLEEKLDQKNKEQISDTFREEK